MLTLPQRSRTHTLLVTHTSALARARAGKRAQTGKSGRHTKPLAANDVPLSRSGFVANADSSLGASQRSHFATHSHYFSWAQRGSERGSLGKVFTLLPVRTANVRFCLREKISQRVIRFGFSNCPFRCCFKILSNFVKVEYSFILMATVVRLIEEFIQQVTKDLKLDEVTKCQSDTEVGLFHFAFNYGFVIEITRPTGKLARPQLQICHSITKATFYFYQQVLIVRFFFLFSAHSKTSLSTPSTKGS